MKSTKYIIFFFLFALLFGSCKEEVGYKKGTARPYVRISERDIVMETFDENKVTITPIFDSEQTAEGKFNWSIADKEIGSIVENEDKSVTITGLKPGKTYLKIESEDGTLYYTSTLKINKAFEFKYPIFMDFGVIQSDKPFNNLLTPNDGALVGLVDQEGFLSKYSIEVDGGFATLDRDSHSNTLGFPDNVAFDMFFNDGIHVASSGFVLSKLSANSKYTFLFYTTIAENNVTETEYIVKGSNEGSALMYTSKNQSNLAVVENITPDENGEIKIRLQAGPNNTQWAKFYGINALIIVPENYELTFPLKFD